MLKDLLLLSFSNPRAAARAVLDLNVSSQARWIALVLVAVLSTLLTQLGLLLVPLPASSPIEFWMQDARLALPAQVLFLVAVALAITLVGRRFGGRARFQDALVLVAWLEMVMFVVQVAQLVTLVVLPLAAFGVGLASVMLFFWLLTAFTAEVNGFYSLFKVFFGIVATMFLIAFALVAVTAMLGQGITGLGG